MKSSQQSLSRRKALKQLAMGLGGALALSAERAPAAPGAHLDPKDPAAAKLGYVEAAGQVDGKKYPTFAKGQTCENCLQLQGEAGAPYRPCTVFPGKVVAAAGWCSAWSAEI